MGLDYSIPLQQTQVQMPNVMAMHANALTMQNAMNQNRKGELEYQNALVAQQDDQLARQIYSEVGGDQKKAIEAFKTKGLYKQAIALEDKLFARRKELAQIDKDELEANIKRADTISGLLAPLAAKGDAVTHDDVFNAIKVGQGLQVIPEGFVSQVPMNKMSLPQWIQTSVMGAKNGRESLKALQQEIQYLDVGGQRIAVNMNPQAAGGVGPVAGMAPLAKTMTPEGAATDARAAATLAEQKRHNQVTEGFSRARDTREAADAGKDKPLTESQGAATGFGMRAQEAQNIIARLEKDKTFGRVSSKTEAAQDVLEGLPVIGKSVGKAVGGVVTGAANTVMSDAQQKYAQAKRNFISAVLRKESGATITPEEFANADKQYFPQAGDGDDVIKQKADNRNQAISALRVQAGSGAKNIPGGRSVADMSDDAIKKALGL